MANPSTTRVIANPGGKKYHHIGGFEIRAREVYAWFTIVPHETIAPAPGGGRQDLVRDAAVEAADQTNQGAQDHGDRGGGEADQQRNPAAVDEEGEDVPSLVVGSQDVGIRWRVERDCSLDGGRIGSGDDGCENRHGEEDEDDDRPRERESIPEQLAKERLEPIEIV